ncbi:MAG: hypothetical protein ABH875_06235, partial [Candidatus Omnitrophota bacterium]
MSPNVKAKEYNRLRNRLALLEPAIIFIAFSVIQASGASAYIKEISYKAFSSIYLSTALYALIFGVLFYIATFYLGFYRSYILEHRFGLSNQDLAHWIKDEAKRSAISLVFFMIFVEFLYVALRNSPAMWWAYLAAVWIFITIV